MDDNQFRQLLEFLGFSWRGYRKVRKGVKKKVGRHMREMGCRNMREYLDQLARKESSKNRCEQIMSVSISRFFRDRRLWEVLESRILPELIESGGTGLRVWSAGCACGEEVYSLKIVWEKIRRSLACLPALDITATDLNPVCIQKAKDGIYPKSSLKNVPENLRTIWFQAESGEQEFRVKPVLKDRIRWLPLDFLAGPSGDGFHLIFLRNNLFTYYRDERIRPAFNEIVKALSAGGYLIIGSNERIPFQTRALEPYPPHPNIFKKAPPNLE